MFEVSPEDVLRGLKRFKRLAKQDLLASNKTPNPRFWTVHAEARRKTYDLLMERIEKEGLQSAYEMARHTYVNLPLLTANAEDHPEVRGQEQALDLFFEVLGLNRAQVDQLRQQRPTIGDAPVPLNAR